MGYEPTPPHFFLFHTSPLLPDRSRQPFEAWTESDSYGHRYLLDRTAQEDWVNEELAQFFIGGSEAFHINLHGPGKGLYAMIARRKIPDGFEYTLRRCNGVEIRVNDQLMAPESSQTLSHGDIIEIGHDRLHVRDERRYQVTAPNPR